MACGGLHYGKYRNKRKKPKKYTIKSISKMYDSIDNSMSAQQRQSHTHTHIEVTINKSCNFEWPFYQSMTHGISSTVLMESMDCAALLDRLPGTDFHELSCHSNLLTQE